MPAISVLFFGNLTEISGFEKISVELNRNIRNTDDIRQYLIDKYPDMKRNKFSMAVNQEIVLKNVKLSDGDEVALLPPFAGG